jgi:NitT/TauT family transport system permease protein
MIILNKYGAILAFLLLWETASRLEIINPVLFPPFTSVVETIIRLTANGVLTKHIVISLSRAVSGFLIAALVGLPLGLALGGFFKRLNLAAELPTEVLSQVNPFLLFHVIILFMGLGEAPKITIVAWTCLWPILFGAMNGAAQVNPALLKAGRAFGLSKTGLISKIVVKAAGPLIFSGLRLSLGYSMFMLIAAEMMGASSGLGWLVIRSQENFQLDRMYAGVTVIAFLGLALDCIIYLSGRKYLSLAKQDLVNAAGD